jgi:predicted nucleic acid-binding protein
MIIVDTTVWIDYLRGVNNPETNWLDRELQKTRLGLTDVILCEVLQGIQDPASFRRVCNNLLLFAVFSVGGVEIAVAAAENYRFLRRRGYTIRRTIDCLIATFCLRAQHRLLHRDRDFDAFESELGLQVLHP